MRRLSTLPRPWFLDRAPPPHMISPRDRAQPPPPPVPPGVPLPLRSLHAELAKSPLLETSALVITTPRPLSDFSAPIPVQRPSGRRKQDSMNSYPSEYNLFDTSSGLWDWVMFAQVKDGTENRGSVEAILRITRRLLLTSSPAVALPPNSKRRGHNGWALVDAGSFAVHILSRAVRERYFEEPQSLRHDKE